MGKIAAVLVVVNIMFILNPDFLFDQQETRPMTTSDQQEQPTLGMKFDSAKPRFSLVPRKALMRTIDVLEAGAKKYAENNWREVDNAEQRYLDAAFRHLVAHMDGQYLDPETNLPHLAHILCCIMFTLELQEDRRDCRDRGDRGDHALDALSYTTAPLGARLCSGGVNSSAPVEVPDRYADLSPEGRRARIAADLRRIEELRKKLAAHRSPDGEKLPQAILRCFEEELEQLLTFYPEAVDA